jgi:hypothetical protein
MNVQTYGYEHHLVLRNYKDTHRNKPENYFLGFLTVMAVSLIDYEVVELLPHKVEHRLR